MPVKPPTPGWFSKVNFVVGYVWQKCDVPWQVYVQYAKAPVGDAALMLVALDWKDIFKEFWRPKGLRSGRHGRKGTKSRRPGISLLDPSELVAEHIEGREIARGRPFGSPTFWVYEITDVIDRVGWSLCCVDLVTDIGYGTLLGIIEDKQVFCPAIDRMFRDDFDQTILNTHQGWASFPVSHIEWVHGVDTPNGVVATVFKNARYMATLECYGTQTTPGDVEIGIGIYDFNAGKNINESNIITNSYPNEIHLQVDAIFTGPGSIGCSVSTNTPGHPGPGGQHVHFTSMKWLILEISPDADA